MIEVAEHGFPHLTSATTDPCFSIGITLSFRRSNLRKAPMACENVIDRICDHVSSCMPIGEDMLRSIRRLESAKFITYHQMIIKNGDDKGSSGRFWSQ